MPFPPFWGKASFAKNNQTTETDIGILNLMVLFINPGEHGLDRLRKLRTVHGKIFEMSFITSLF